MSDSDPTRVVVGLSGGVDSSAAASLLVEDLAPHRGSIVLNTDVQPLIVVRWGWRLVHSPLEFNKAFSDVVGVVHIRGEKGGWFTHLGPEHALSDEIVRGALGYTHRLKQRQ